MVPLASVPAEYKASGPPGEGGPTGRVGDQKGDFPRFTAGPGQLAAQPPAGKAGKVRRYGQNPG